MGKWRDRESRLLFTEAVPSSNSMPIAIEALYTTLFSKVTLD